MKAQEPRPAPAVSGPIVIGLTGGIGTGKSNVRQALVSLGAEGIDADRVAHDVMAPGGPAFAAVAASFGDLLTPDGRIDRGRLGARVFADPAALDRLEQIVHPAVGEAVRMRVAASRAPLVVIEAIKLLEAGLGGRGSAGLCDQVWVTRCTRRQQFSRLAQSRGMPAAEVRRRLAAQMPPREMAKHADRVIDTQGTLAETGLQALAAWAELGLAPPPPQVRAGSIEDAEGLAAIVNAIVREGGLTVLDKVPSVGRERAFLRRLPPRACLTLAQVGSVTAGFQILEPYATWARAMNHVATLGSYVAAPMRGRGLGEAMSRFTFRAAHTAGFSKLVVAVRADNSAAQGFYSRLGFRLCGHLVQQAYVDGHYVDELLFELSLPDIGENT